MTKNEYKAYLQSAAWVRLRQLSLERFGHRCGVCYSDGKLSVHHRTYERTGAELVEDLIPLCERCHDLFHVDASPPQVDPEPEHRPMLVGQFPNELLVDECGILIDLIGLLIAHGTAPVKITEQLLSLPYKGHVVGGVLRSAGYFSAFDDPSGAVGDCIRLILRQAMELERATVAQNLSRFREAGNAEMERRTAHDLISIERAIHALRRTNENRTPLA